MIGESDYRLIQESKIVVLDDVNDQNVIRYTSSNVFMAYSNIPPADSNQEGHAILDRQKFLREFKINIKLTAPISSNRYTISILPWDTIEAGWRAHLTRHLVVPRNHIARKSYKVIIVLLVVAVGLIIAGRVWSDLRTVPLAVCCLIIAYVLFRTRVRHTPECTLCMGPTDLADLAASVPRPDKKIYADYVDTNANMSNIMRIIDDISVYFKRLYEFVVKLSSKPDSKYDRYREALDKARAGVHDLTKSNIFPPENFSDFATRIRTMVGQSGIRADLIEAAKMWRKIISCLPEYDVYRDVMTTQTPKDRRGFFQWIFNPFGRS